MLQTLFHIPKEIAGLPLFGAGVLLVLWAVASAAVLFFVIRRHGLGADTWGHIGLLAVVGAAIFWVLPALCDDDGLPVRGYGTMLLLAVLAATALTIRRARPLGLPVEMIFSLAFWVFLPGILGARLFYVAEYWAKYQPAFAISFGKGLAAVVNIAEGGLVVFGGLAGGIVGLVLFARRYRLPLLVLADLVVPALLLGQAIGRLGCLLNGCCFGGVCDCPWAITFPPSSPVYQSQLVRGQFLGFDLSEDPAAPPIVRHVVLGSPAFAAGLRNGERLLGINGRRIATAGAAGDLLKDLQEREVAVILEVEGREAVRLPTQALPARGLPVHPTQLYSAIDAALLCLLLLAYEPFRRSAGELFALGLGGHAIARFLLEAIRTDEAPVFGTGLSISQNVSVLMLLCAVGLWWYSRRQAIRCA